MGMASYKLNTTQKIYHKKKNKKKIVKEAVKISFLSFSPGHDLLFTWDTRNLVCLLGNG